MEFYIIGGILLVIIMYIITLRNKFVSLSLRVENGMASIDNQLKRRYDLIPNLVETVKGYAKHEKELFEKIALARSGLMSGNIDEKMAANDQTSQLMSRLLAVAESYPELKANEGFNKLQVELVGTEDKIAYARQYYNDTVFAYNNMILKFPSNLVASMFNFARKTFFEIDEIEKENIKVEF